MKILAIEHESEGAAPEAFRPLLADEARCVWELYQAGLVRECYFQAERDCAVLVLECASPGDAAAVLARLPLVQAGLISFEIIPLRAYPGFARLFSRMD